jgi:hypothetical protein
MLARPRLPNPLAHYRDGDGRSGAEDRPEDHRHDPADAGGSMLYVSRLVPDPDTMAEFVAGLWQGPIPDDLVLHRWIYLDGKPRQMLLIWEGDDDATRFVEERFGSFGTLTTEAAADGTPGLAACFARDLEGFGSWYRAYLGASEDFIAAELELRDGGLQATTFDDARQSGRSWRDTHPN